MTHKVIWRIEVAHNNYEKGLQHLMRYRKQSIFRIILINLTKTMVSTGVEGNPIIIQVPPLVQVPQSWQFLYTVPEKSNFDISELLNLT